MTKEGIITDLLDVTKYADSEEIYIRDCIIEDLSLGFATFAYPVTIEKCIIGTIRLHSTWFMQGLTLKNCIVKGKVEYEAGENRQSIIIRNNIFLEPFIFWDCYFEADIIVQENIFSKDCSLLDTSNHFCTVCKSIHNFGAMNMKSEQTLSFGGNNFGKDMGLVEIE